MAVQALTPMNPGQTKKVHVKVYGADQAHNPSQNVDLTVPITTTSSNSAIAFATIDPNDNRAVIVTAQAQGTCNIVLNEATDLPAAGQLTLQVTVNAPPIDNRRIDFLSEDPAV